MKLILLMILMCGCTFDFSPEIQRDVVVLIKKEDKWRGENKRVAQWWQVDNRVGVIFFELLPEGDTGNVIGTKKELLNRR